MEDPFVRTQLILVGNGLDIALGLKTRYSDFILYYLKHVLEELKNDSISTLTGKAYYSRQSKFYGIHGNVSIYRSPIDFNYCFSETYKELLSETDVISIVLKLSENKFSLDRSSFFSDLLRSAEWCDIERSYYTHLVKLVEREKSNRQLPPLQNERDTVVMLNEEMDELKRHLEIYLQEEQKRIPSLLEKNNDLKVLLRQLHASPFDRHGSSLCVSFNYTGVMTLAFEKLPGTVTMPVLYIHGELGNEDNPIIFGYGDDTDEHFRSLESANVDEYLRHFKAYSYSQNNNYQTLLAFMERGESFNVVILGHSCGLSDRTLLKTIFEHERCTSIEVYHYKEDVKEARIEFFYKDINIGRHFDKKALKRERVMSFDPRLKIPQNKK